jgi:hypothetical protein
MTTPAVINAVANCTTAFSALGLLIHIFGDPDNSVWDNNVKAWLAKSGLSVVVCGAIANVLTLSSPATSEIILNCGMSLTFFWLSWWQWEMFKEMQRESERKRIARNKKSVVKKQTKRKPAKTV